MDSRPPMWKIFLALTSARLDCLVSSSGADYKAWSGADQNCNVFVRSSTSQPDLSQTRTSRRAGLNIARFRPDQTINCHEIIPYGHVSSRSRDKNCMLIQPCKISLFVYRISCSKFGRCIRR